MPVDVDGSKHFCINEIAETLGVSRQTLWRWRCRRKIPQGSRFRDGRILFNPDELEQIRLHANHLEPMSEDARRQLELFRDARSLKTEDPG